MRRLFRLAAYVAAIVVGGFIGCGLAGERVIGSGNSATETRELGEVTEVDLSGIGELVLTSDEKPGLTITADDNILPHLESVTEGKTLILRTKSGSYTPKTPITYRLSAKALAKVKVSGAATVSSKGFSGTTLEVDLSGASVATLRGLDLKSLTLTLSGAGNATIAGTAQALVVKVSGAGHIKASDLEAKSAEATVSGAGNVEVWATGSLKGHVSGAGNVKYKGHPKVEQNVSGAGSISPLTR